MSKKIIKNLLVVLFILSIGFILGWISEKKFYPKYRRTDRKLSDYPLRLQNSSYKFVSPLLVCNTDSATESPELEGLREKVNTLIDEEIQKKNIEVASVYFRDLNTGNQFNINPEEKFNPASLNKVPLMMNYYKIARNNPEILDKMITVENPIDQNSTQEIKPSDFAKNGEAYTVEELIEKMIKYSDNNSFEALVKEISPDSLRSTFRELKIPCATDITSNQNETVYAESMSASDYSYFLRVLYNATYLKRDLSEKALSILAETDFQEGLRAGIPKDIALAHKFGLAGFYPPELASYNIVTRREFHDCGLVYHPKKPYLICVMTKSSADIDDIEATIKQVSKLAYNEVDQNQN